MTWIQETPHGPAVARLVDGTYLVDYPADGRFRCPESDFDPLKWTDLAGLPSRLDDLAGWYEGGRRRILLTQVPEDYYGEPMMMVAESHRVTRAYAVSETELVLEDGGRLRLLADHVQHGQTVMTRCATLSERQVSFCSGDVTLAGTLITPSTPGPHPATVMLHGAAGGQRDYCRLQAEPVLDAGVAVLIFDKAGHGRSGGSEPSIYDQAGAAEAAIDFLSTQPDVDSSRIGLSGLSNGMWAVPMAALRAAFVTGVGAPGVSMAGAEVHRRTKVLRDSGVSEATAALAGQAWECIFSTVANGPSGPVTQRLDQALQALAAAADINAYQVPDFVERNPMLSPVPPLMPVNDLIAMLAAERDPQLAYDPVDGYAALRCPVFLQYGSRDTCVPAALSAARIAAANPRAEIRTYPGLEHLLNILPSGFTGLSPEDVMVLFHGFRFEATAREDLTNWLRATMH